MRGGVILPERAQIADLPPFNGFARSFVTRVWREPVSQGPAANTGAVGFEVEAAMQFAGDGAVGGRWFGGQELGQEGNHRSGPLGLMIAAGNSGRPDGSLALCMSPQVLAVELVETWARQAQFPGSFVGGKFTVAMTCQEMADDRGWESFNEL